MRVDEFNYELPEELIAQKPADKRDYSRLMKLDRQTGDIEEGIFRDILNYLKPGDLLVLNNSRVRPARLYGQKIPTGTEIEVLLLNKLEEGRWEVLVRPGKRVKKGVKISFGNDKLISEAVEYTDFGGRIMEFSYSGDFEQIIEKLGEMPLPPYIKESLENPERYQTVYARHKGSAAAPTAGLHFTPDLLEELENRGINRAEITLHVGLGTFRPVRTDRVEDHQMHEEYFEISREVAERIEQTCARGDRVVAVGTTVTRALESAATDFERIEAYQGWTDKFIYPGYKFRVLDGLITNFHLPQSTLLMLVSAFAGKDNILNAYQEAIDREFRFYSLGDAMLII